MKQKIRFLTASISILFVFSLFTIYRTIITVFPVITENNEIIPLKSDYIDSDKIVSLHNQVPVRYGSLGGIFQSSSFSSSSSSQSISNNFKQAEFEIQNRIARVDKLCKKYHLGKYKWDNNSNDLNLKEPPTPLFSYYFWNKGHKLGWCPVYKAGSTSWLVNMMILAGFTENELNNSQKQLSILAREIYGDSEPDAETLEKSLKLLVVRHPFERLISAYRDKLSNSTVGHEHGTHHFYKKYGSKIVKKFRKDTSITQIEPTWEEFVRYILATDLIQYSDDHWLPSYYSCTPCLVDFDFIAKLETYSRDQEYIIHKLGLEKVLKSRWNHKLEKSGPTTKDEQMKQYFSKLTKSQIEGLYKKYWFDFELFGYEYKEDWLKYGKE